MAVSDNWTFEMLRRVDGHDTFYSRYHRDLTVYGVMAVQRSPAIINSETTHDRGECFRCQLGGAVGFGGVSGLRPTLCIVTGKELEGNLLAGNLVSASRLRLACLPVNAVICAGVSVRGDQ